jgi:hypothetical protein
MRLKKISENTTRRSDIRAAFFFAAGCICYSEGIRPLCDGRDEWEDTHRSVDIFFRNEKGANTQFGQIADLQP